MHQVQSDVLLFQIVSTGTTVNTAQCMLQTYLIATLQIDWKHTHKLQCRKAIEAAPAKSAEAPAAQPQAAAPAESAAAKVSNLE